MPSLNVINSLLKLANVPHRRHKISAWIDLLYNYLSYTEFHSANLCIANRPTEQKVITKQRDTCRAQYAKAYVAKNQMRAHSLAMYERIKL
jgi:hypothetical protein